MARRHQTGTHRQGVSTFRQGVSRPVDPANDGDFPRSEVVADLAHKGLGGAAFGRLLDDACRSLRDVLDADAVGVAELRPAREDLVLREGVGFSDEWVADATIDASSGSQTGYTVRTWEPTVVQDVRDDERFSTSPLVEDTEFSSLVTAVVPGHTRPWGVVTVLSTETGAFEDEDVLLVQSVGHILGQSISASRIERERTRSQAASERFDRFAEAACWDLPEALETTSRNLQLVDARYKHRLDAEGREIVEEALRATRRMEEMVESLRRFARVRTNPNALETVDAQTVFEDTLNQLAERVRATNADVTAEELPVVRADRDQLAQVFGTLLSNALMYSGDAPPRIHVCADPLGDEWRFSVHDEGPGIQPEHTDEVFDLFRRLDGADGIGMGLAIAREIVDRHGGDLWVDATPGEGSTFSFTMPKADA